MKLNVTKRLGGITERDYYFMLSISDASEIKQTVKISEEGLNGHIVKLKTKSDEFLAITDSGSPMSFPK